VIARIFFFFFFEGRTNAARIRGKKEKKGAAKEERGARRRKRMLLVRIHASVGPARCGRARNIKVSNYNARHDTSFRPSSIKSHETPDGGHRYRVICAPVAMDYPLEEMPERERKGEKRKRWKTWAYYRTLCGPHRDVIQSRALMPSRALIISPYHQRYRDFAEKLRQ